MQPWFALAIVAPLAAGAAAGGCKEVPASILLEVRAAEGLALDELRLSVFDRVGVAVSDRRLPERGAPRLPDTVVLYPRDPAGTQRILVRGFLVAGEVGQGVALVAGRPGEQVHGSVLIVSGLPDGDQDGVPDAIDDCPSLPDPAQGRTTCAGLDLRVDLPASDGPRGDGPRADRSQLDRASDAAKLDAPKRDAAKLDTPKLDSAKKPDAPKPDTAKKPDAPKPDKTIPIPDKSVSIPDQPKPDTCNPSPLALGEACVVDLASCTEAQKASAWKGMTSLTGNIISASYLSKTGLMCMSSVGQAWPVITEPTWWCGIVKRPGC